jgi:hypothetical protein
LASRTPVRSPTIPSLGFDRGSAIGGEFSNA